MEWTVDLYYIIKLLLIFLGMIKVLLLYGSQEIFTIVLGDKVSGCLQFTFKQFTKNYMSEYVCVCVRV